MQEDIFLELANINKELTPILSEFLKDIDCKTATIYFAGLTKNLLELLDDESFEKIIIQYLTNGDKNVSL